MLSHVARMTQDDDKTSREPIDQMFEAVPTQSLVAAARAQIERAIARGDLAPGQKLIEGHIASRLGMSRGPVREAARLLENQGLLVSHPRRGFFVREFREKDIDDLYEMRACIWGYAIQVAAERVTPEDIAELNRQYDRMLELADAGPSHVFLDSVITFHQTICRMSRNERLTRVFDDLSVEIRQVMAVLGISFSRPMNTARSQRVFIEALLQRDGERAMAEVRSYVCIAREDARRNTVQRTKREKKDAA